MSTKVFAGLLLAVMVVFTGCQPSEKPPVVKATLTLVEQAQHAYDAKEYQEALAKSDLALQKNDADNQAMYIRGLASYKLNELSIAKDALLAVKDSYKTDTFEGRLVLKTLAQTYFFTKDYANAYTTYAAYIAAKQTGNSHMLDDDLYWAGVIADVNLKDTEKQKWWSKLTTAYKKSKGIK